MHVFAVIFVLTALVLAFGIIGTMLFAHRERIIKALVGLSVETDFRVISATFGNNWAVPRQIHKLPTTALPPLPLAA